MAPLNELLCEQSTHTERQARKRPKWGVGGAVERPGGGTGRPAGASKRDGRLPSRVKGASGAPERALTRHVAVPARTGAIRVIRVNMGVGPAGVPILRERRGWIMATRQGTIDGHGCAGVDVRSRCWWRGEQSLRRTCRARAVGRGVGAQVLVGDNMGSRQAQRAAPTGCGAQAGSTR